MSHEHALSRRAFLSASALTLGTAALAVVGTGIVEGSGVENSGILTGFLLMQLSNLCFAFGQVYYKELLRDTPGIKDRDIFALLYAGGVLVGGLGAIIVFSQGGFFKLFSKKVIPKLQIQTTEIVLSLHIKF